VELLNFRDHELQRFENEESSKIKKPRKDQTLKRKSSGGGASDHVRDPYGPSFGELPLLPVPVYVPT
jgi:hypothetical protein